MKQAVQFPLKHRNETRKDGGIIKHRPFTGKLDLLATGSAREKARRRAQIAKGSLKAANGLVP